MPWEDVEPILRPNMDDIHMGAMKVEEEKCNKCGLCIDNCPFRCWEKNDDGYPIMKEEYACFSCYNCKVACPNDAVSIIESYHVDDGYWKTDPHPLPAVMPREARDAEGNPTEWNEIEKAVFTRRSVRNYKDKPVPDSLVQRVLEAGRFAPSAGNCQPWKFIVITDKALIAEINNVTKNLLGNLYNMYMNDKSVKGLTAMVEGPPRNVSAYDPRVMLGGFGTISKYKELDPSMDAPVVILLLADERSIASPELNLGICGQNMNLVANSLGIKACWNGFLAAGVNFFQPIKNKLGIAKPWTAVSSLCLGYPKFKQEGIVPREDRPVAWFRDASKVQEDVSVLQTEKQEV
ncbi:MAG: nitroreductase family protein [Promethearchaeota archaeon]|jgi:nitroreductase/ferredoxin